MFKTKIFVSLGAALAVASAVARMPSDPLRDPRDFQVLPNGRSLSSIRVSGAALTLSRGTGVTFGATQREAYRKLKASTQSGAIANVQWVFMDLDAGQVVAQSRSPDKRIFGASSSKIFVGATLLDRNHGSLTSSQIQLMADMLVVSSNEAWTELQRQIGGGSADEGRARNFAFTQRMGYLKTLGFQGTWGSKHGNELTATDTAHFILDTYRGRYEGAETLWKLMHTCRTGASRGKKYLPSSLYVGGKTGTYDGPTYDTDAGKTISVAIRNHVVIFHAGGRSYGLVVLANSGSDETAALLAGGLYREYVNP